ncbi:DUF559 domain-containing protein [Luteipulveratus halotolerans]|uniref:DUF559 domain-containing protein n=1 Tax=Luteipulveratus halotolerans TaxID=1631356 RepID=UPI00068255A7|nr:DUF559 domain-containing protein [Luteipulveratus halotolerans]
MATNALDRMMTELGGAATYGQLRTIASKRAIGQAVDTGRLIRLARNRDATSELAEHAASAHGLSGTMSHGSAAAHYGWSMKHEPQIPVVTVRPNRHLTRDQQCGVRTVWRDLSSAERSGAVTSPLRTVVDCALTMPFDEALAVADSACRAGDVDEDTLIEAAGRVRGRGARQARRVLRESTSLAANPLESVLRAIALDVAGLDVSPQVQICEPGVWAVVDLADVSLGLVLEAEGFAFHGTRKGFEKDCERYSSLTCLGWLVLRFTWKQVMRRPDWVRDRIADAVRLRGAGLPGGLASPATRAAAVPRGRSDRRTA